MNRPNTPQDFVDHLVILGTAQARLDDTARFYLETGDLSQRQLAAALGISRTTLRARLDRDEPIAGLIPDPGHLYTFQTPSPKTPRN